MPYDERFKHAKTRNGKPYRDERTGNLIEYCFHRFIVYPEFGSEDEFHAKFIPLERKTFEGFEGTCQFCGEIIYIDAENVVKDSETQDKILRNSFK